MCPTITAGDYCLLPRSGRPGLPDGRRFCYRCGRADNAMHYSGDTECADYFTRPMTLYSAIVEPAIGDALTAAAAQSGIDRDTLHGELLDFYFARQ